MHIHISLNVHWITAIMIHSVYHDALLYGRQKSFCSKNNEQHTEDCKGESLGGTGGHSSMVSGDGGWQISGFDEYTVKPQKIILFKHIHFSYKV